MNEILREICDWSHVSDAFELLIVEKGILSPNIDFILILFTKKVIKFQMWDFFGKQYILIYLKVFFIFFLHFQKSSQPSRDVRPFEVYI